MALQTLPQSASRYARSTHAEVEAATHAVARQWRRMGSDFEASWFSVSVALQQVTGLAQLRIAESAAAYVPAVMAETGQEVAYLGAVRPSSLVSVAGDGRPVESLLYGAVVRSRVAVGAGASVPQALRAGGQWLMMATGTVLSDTGRAAERVAMAAHGAGGYVRMLVPPSCSRCAILAGRVYSDSVAFQRHPRCDCRHIPASESTGSEMTVDPREYFDSLSGSEQGEIFTVDGAEAIRNGADPAQVVNARRGMRTAQVAGRRVLTTTEGTTSRGLAGRSGGYRTTRVRLMPESIRTLAGNDRAEYLRLLRSHGFIR